MTLEKMSNEHDGYGVSAETFQAIIWERKAEKNGKAEEKRVEILKSIRDRKSKFGMDPLDQFPKEVWDAVLDKLDKPKDLSNVSQVHCVFSDLLERRKVRDMLFPQLVGLPIQTDSGADPKILSLARDLNMRSLSKSMRNAVDRWYEDNLLQHLGTGKNVNKGGMPTVWLNQPEVVKGLLKNYVGSGSDDPKAIRFPLRSICTVLSAPDFDDMLVWDEEHHLFLGQCANDRGDIRSLLEVIGDQVWHFRFNVGSIDLLVLHGITLPQIYDTLLEWIALMPNLKWLELIVGEACISRELRKGESIASHLANHPFPTLEHLERLDVIFNSTSIEVFEIYEAIFPTNRHLKRLHIDGYDNELLELERLPVARVQQMESLETLCIGDEFIMRVNWCSILSILNIQWHLKQIQLGISEEDLTFAIVFSVLENFPTLEQVALNLESVRITGDLKFLALPNLNELELKFDPIIDFQSGSIVQFFFSLQFLLYCGKLKRLHWENDNGELNDWKLNRFMTNRECHERMINFRGGCRNLNHSNIWDVFPYLDTVEVYLFNSKTGLWIKSRFRRSERDLPNDKYEVDRSW